MNSYLDFNTDNTTNNIERNYDDVLVENSVNDVY